MIKRSFDKVEENNNNNNNNNNGGSKNNNNNNNGNNNNNNNKSNNNDGKNNNSGNNSNGGNNYKGNNNNNGGNNYKNGGNNNNGGNNSKRPEFTGSIINRTENKIHFSGYLKKKYCADFGDIEKTCNRRLLCLFQHALFPLGYHEDDIAPMVKFIDDSRNLAWHANVTVPVSSKSRKTLYTILILLGIHYILYLFFY